MKKFLIRLLWFFLPMFLIAYPADLFISKILRSSNNFAHLEYPDWNDIFKGRIHANVIIYGSSRAWMHIDPQMISDSLKTTAYNLGIDGHNFGLQYLRHREFMKYNQKPKVIIHSLDLSTLTTNRDLYNSEQFLPYMLGNKDLKKSLLTYNGFRPVDFDLPLIRYYGQYSAIKEVIGQYTGLDANLPRRIHGFEAQDKIWDGKFDKIKKTLKASYVKLDPQKVRLFESYLMECRQKNIQVIFVQTPEYIEGQAFDINREEIMGRLKAIARKYDIPFLSYSKDSLCYDKKYFFNAMHLNKKGAELFNAKLVNDLRGTGIDFN